MATTDSQAPLQARVRHAPQFCKRRRAVNLPRFFQVIRS